MADKRIAEISIRPAENGGHTVMHRYKEQPKHSGKLGMQVAYVEPEQHVFGPEDGHKMLAHVANHLHIPEPKDTDGDGD